MTKSVYARFYKCDLQMHTPLSQQWLEDKTRLRSSDNDDLKREVARSYLRACHDVGLEVIGITDHNFASEPGQSFLKWLNQENAYVAQEMGRDPLVIFPGFEVEADVGKGCHVLCLFPPDAKLEVVDSRLTAMGLPPDKRFEKQQPKQCVKNLRDILDIVQGDTNARGIVVCAHPTGDDGLFDNDKISEWLQKEEFTNPELLCLEVPKPLDKMAGGWQRLFQGQDACAPEWRRQTPIACIMSSDCYRLEKFTDQPSNYVGCRYTWIKMSYPSIESLRQACLDPDSRIRLTTSSPEIQYTYPLIQRITAKDTAFLKRTEEISWSPNLNCLIGSRGTGKSTLVDYMRLLLDRLRPDDLPASLLDEVTDRVYGTLLPNSCLKMELKTPGGVYCIEYRHGGEPARQVYPPGATVPDPMLDVRTLFPCRFLSQREIDHSVGKRDRKALRNFLDDFLHPELNKLASQEAELKGKILQVEVALSTKRENQKQRAVIETQRRELQAQLESQKLLIGLLPRWQAMVAENDFFQRLFKDCEQLISSLSEYVSNITLTATSLNEQLKAGPNHELISEVSQIAANAVTALQQNIITAIECFIKSTSAQDSTLLKAYTERWKPMYDELQKAVLDAQKLPQENGTKIENVEEIPARLLTLEQQIQTLDTESKEIDRLESDRTNAVVSLHKVWTQQTECRRKKAAELMERLRPHPDKKPYVEIEVGHQGEVEDLITTLEGRIPDKRKLNEEDIRELIYQLASGQRTNDSSLLLAFIAEVRKADSGTLISQVLTERKSEAMYKAFTDAVLRQLETERVPDSVMYYVYRRDGTLAGPIDKVSAGQQGTAILNLLLASGNEPLVVDTPEEGLDNEGVYAELVPLFRLQKEMRQIIVVTHNANLPVNADAEGIFALEASGCIDPAELNSSVKDSGCTLTAGELDHVGDLIRWSTWQQQVHDYLVNTKHCKEEAAVSVLKRIGVARRAEGRIKRIIIDGRTHYAVGALDAPAVKRAVQDIMEGSEDAFRRRREKYGF